MILIASIWLLIGIWLVATGRAGCDVYGKAPTYIHVYAIVSAVVIGPPLYLYVLITGKDI